MRGNEEYRELRKGQGSRRGSRRGRKEEGKVDRKGEGRESEGRESMEGWKIKLKERGI